MAKNLTGKHFTYCEHCGATPPTIWRFPTLDNWHIALCGRCLVDHVETMDAAIIDDYMKYMGVDVFRYVRAVVEVSNAEDGTLPLPQLPASELVDPPLQINPPKKL